MATTPYFLWPSQQASSGSDMGGFGFGAAPEEAAEMAMVAPELAEAVARPRLRRHTSGSGSGSGSKQQAGGGGAKKPPQRGLGVAELERLRCGGDPLRDLNAAAAAAAAAAAMGDAAANVQGNSVLLHHHHHHHDHLPVFDAATASSRFYSPLLVQPPPPAPPAPPAPVSYYVQSRSACRQSVAPEEQYFMDRWGRMGGFVPEGSAGSGHHLQPQLPAPAPEHPSSQSTIWRPASSSASPLHTGHRCELCSKTMRALTERGSRTPAAAAAAAATTTAAMPDYSIYDLAAAMASARKEKGEGLLAREGMTKKEVREIEFFPTSTNHGAGAGGPDESEFATVRWTAAPFSSSSSSSATGGGCAPQLDLSLKL